jgi:hypothetical protein
MEEKRVGSCHRHLCCVAAPVSWSYSQTLAQLAPFRCVQASPGIVGRWHGSLSDSDGACSGLSCLSCCGRAGLVSTIGGSDAGFLDGAANQARFHYPHSAAVSPDGSKLFVSDGWNQRIRVVLLSKGSAPLPVAAREHALSLIRGIPHAPSACELCAGQRAG